MTATMEHAPSGTHAPQILYPGDVACGGRGERLETLLGSCVAVVMTDPRRTAGAMCHIVHPAPAPAGRAHDTAYADAALMAMWLRLRERGLQPQLCEAYVYGGGNMFPGIYPHRPIGERSVQQVLDALTHNGVRLLHHDVGGAAYRRLAWTVGPDAPSVTAIGI
ncbi:chemotaxis protein CheD [Piscinibacter aquaticus]|uniref:Chemotaxis protein CheD n=1 Tax=Piscinibacter aquaticus TaxID=392597 RepID=A0A5C6TZF3_9BURK|nr:chemotaxis protein CheD [Piscinibacter aquaticus]